MSKTSIKKSLPTLILTLILSTAVVYGVYSLLTPSKKLPVYNPADINSKLVDKSLINKRSNHKIADFELINQNGKKITHKDYENKIYVADFFFTKCGTICPVMTSNMAKLQDAFLNDKDVKLLSHSVTPLIDSVPVLNAYAKERGIIESKWNITTGAKKHIYELARKSYFAVLDEGDGGLQDFIHTENFVLVDKKRQIRGFYDGTSNEDISRLIKDIRILQAEK